MRVLIAGWFSFEQMGATAGDLLARDLVVRWLERARVPYDVALAPPFDGGLDWRATNGRDYSHLVFVCGPFGNSWLISEFLAHFAGSRLIGVNLSMLESLDRWNPFDLLLERDSSRGANADIVFLAEQPPVPVAGLILVHPQREYGDKGRHENANKAFQRVIASREMAVVPIDTRLDVNGNGLRTPGEIESLAARMDIILTNRLHGLVMGLKNGVPVVAIDAIEGGAKVRRQAETIGWPLVFNVDDLDDRTLAQAVEYALTEQAREQARACGVRARELAAKVEHAFLAGLSEAITQPER